MALNSYYVTFAGVNCTTLGLYPVRRPAMPTPARRATKVTIPGRDGDLYVEDGAIEDIQIQITFDFHTPPNEWGNTFRALKAWAARRNFWSYSLFRALRFSDDPDYFYDVKRTIVSTTERVARQIGQATVTFICDGWSYLYAGSYPITPASGWTSMTVDNDTTETAKPAITMICPDATTFTITRPDGTEKIFTFSGSPYRCNINVEREVIYHSATGNSILNRTTGGFDAFWLYPGQTTIAVSATVPTFSLYPCWRVL